VVVELIVVMLIDLHYLVGNELPKIPAVVVDPDIVPVHFVVALVVETAFVVLVDFDKFAAVADDIVADFEAAVMVFVEMAVVVRQQSDLTVDMGKVVFDIVLGVVVEFVVIHSLEPSHCKYHIDA
jgi:hypothetical protein